MAATGVKTAFVVMPFSGTSERHTEVYWTRFFTDFLKPQLARRKYVCTRSQARPESIVKGVLKDLFESDLVIAILTDFNANVWYELGIRHSLRRGTIMMIESGQKLPFDIASYGVLVYEDALAGGPAFEAALDEFIEKIEREHPVDSPAQEFLGPYVMEQLERERRDLEDSYQRKMEEALHSSAAGPLGRPPTPRPESVGIQRPRILWVDDNPHNNEVLIETYRSRGVQFDLALSTDQAVQFLANDPMAYLLIISDMGRGADRDAGIQLLATLKQRWATVPPVVIYCSERAVRAYADKAKELGAMDVTASPKEVSLWIEEAIARRVSVSGSAGR